MQAGKTGSELLLVKGCKGSVKGCFYTVIQGGESQRLGQFGTKPRI